MIIPRSLKERLDEKYIPEPNSGCWIWIGAITKRGYGKISVTRSRPKLAHRMSWLVYRGEIPKGKLVCHHCDNTYCINPEHLWVGTHKENTRDCHMKGRAYNGGKAGVKNGRAILTEKQVIDIRKSKEPIKSIARKYKLHWATIYKIRKHKLWGHI